MAPIALGILYLARNQASSGWEFIGIGAVALVLSVALWVKSYYDSHKSSEPALDTSPDSRRSMVGFLSG